MTIYSKPGIYSYYPSSCVSRYYCWFLELGYPQVDINEYPDGEWELIEYYNAPVVPSLTRWNRILYGIRNTEISIGFVTKFIHQLDLRRKEVWDIAEAKTEAARKEHEALENHAQDVAERAKNAIMQNPALVERIARGGMQEMDLAKIWKHIPRHQRIISAHKPTEVIKS